MQGAGATLDSGPRLRRLLGFLERDPDNLGLIADAASTALDEGDLEEAARLVDRYAALSPLPPALLNLKGLIALSSQRFAEAAEAFEQLGADGEADPAVRFNLAWSRAMLGCYEASLALLDDEVVATSPAAATLKIQMMHHLGLLEEALACGAALAEQRPGDASLMGALSVVAMDAENIELARLYAGRAGDRPDGLSTMGLLSLDEGQVDPSQALFDRALQADPRNPRALLGKGLGLLTKGGSSEAAGLIDKGAEVFSSHIGSWIAAGWAYFVNGDYPASRVRFEKALALDDSFAESHGALAVLDIVENRMEEARRRTEIALRLDRRCFSGALAKSLLLIDAGDASSAERVRNIALNAPIGPDGKTIAQAMVTMGLSARNGPPVSARKP